ncbi:MULTISPECIES: hypothetical protein [unclassified Methylobacterium]|uniref:hypothetical protein n=1 Tax=unclassified Methylobacterium TaxID=2615210 RepID=UPI000B33886F|nr:MULTISPECIES: hypothetical protein [unclassified Methylobacterium]
MFADLVGRHVGIGRIGDLIRTLAGRTDLVRLTIAIAAARAGKPGAASAWWRAK